MQLRWIGQVERFAGHSAAPYILAAISFASSAFLPVAPEVLLVPMALLQPARVWELSIQCTIATTVGALVGYAIGAEFWDLVGQRLIDFYGWAHQFHTFQVLFAKWGVWIIILKALTPIPFKFAAIAAGVVKMNLVTFACASFASRALHFVMIAAFMQWCGPRMMDVIERYETKAAAVAVILLAGVIVYMGCGLKL
jgi:membrane protein YqaA with SNARE-associated domain